MVEPSGLLMNGARIPSEGFNKLVSKIDNTLLGWRSKLLSFAGKITLIKSVILSIPTYYLAGCKLPMAVINKIERLIRNFLWSKDDHSHHYHLIIWKQISKAKDEGGLGLFHL